MGAVGMSAGDRSRMSEWLWRRLAFVAVGGAVDGDGAPRVRDGLRGSGGQALR